MTAVFQPEPARSLESLMEGHNWFLTQFVEIPRWSIIDSFISLSAKAGLYLPPFEISCSWPLSLYMRTKMNGLHDRNIPPMVWTNERPRSEHEIEIFSEGKTLVCLPYTLPQTHSPASLCSLGGQIRVYKNNFPPPPAFGGAIIGQPR